jgi:predicted HicB family RNase H-like nuclease
MKPMKYKSYTAVIAYSDEDSCLVGRIAGINDVVSFHGESVPEIRAAFTEAVEDYIEACRRLGRPAQKSWSGKVPLRVPPELHAQAAMRAEAEGKCLNQWVAEQMKRAL